MKRISIKEWSEKLQQMAVRFTFPLFFVLGFAFLIFININKHNADIDSRIWILFGLGIPLTLAISLLSEGLKDKLWKVVFNLIGIILLTIYAYLLPDKDNFLSVNFYQTFILGIVFTLSCFVVSFFKKDNDISFWEFSKTSIIQFIISLIFAGVLMLGLSLAIVSLKELFNIDIKSEVYENLSAICFAIFAPVYFLSNIPSETEKRKQEYKLDKFLTILGLFILLPILAVYSIILYIYLIQIVVKWELPKGWVTWLVSVLALGGFLTMMIQYPLRTELNKVAVFFARFFPIILFPLLVLMTVGIFRRFDDYGLTINRSYVFLLNFWLYGISIYLFITQSKHLKWIVVTFAGIAFISSVGPWSVFNITRRNMINTIEQILTDNHYLKNGKVIAQNEVAKIKLNKKTEQVLAAKIDYIIEYYGKSELQQFFTENLSKKRSISINDRLNIESEISYYSKNNYFNQSLNENRETINIQEFKELLVLNKDYNSDKLFSDNKYDIELKNNLINVCRKGETKAFIVIALNDRIAETDKTDDNEKTQSQMTIQGKNYTLIINHISGNYYTNTDVFEINQLEANLFLK